MFRRSVDAAQWQRVLAAINDPAYLQMPIADEWGSHEIPTVAIESCFDGNYQLRRRKLISPEQGLRPFMKALSAIEQAGGRAYPMAQIPQPCSMTRSDAGRVARSRVDPIGSALVDNGLRPAGGSLETSS